MERAAQQNRPSGVEQEHHEVSESGSGYVGSTATVVVVARQLLELADGGLDNRVATRSSGTDNPVAAQILKSIDEFIASLAQRAQDISDEKVSSPTSVQPVRSDETPGAPETSLDDTSLVRHDTAVMDRDAVMAAIGDVESLVDGQVTHDATPPDIEHDFVEPTALESDGAVDEITADELHDEPPVAAAPNHTSVQESEAPPVPPPRTVHPKPPVRNNDQDTQTTHQSPSEWPSAPADESDEPDPFGSQGELDEVVWSRDIELLYEDVIYLFQSSDTEGALISLERLLIVAPANEAIQEFVALNEKKLVDVYERLIGPWTKIPRRNVDSKAMPTAYLRDVKIERVARLIDGKTTVDDIFGKVRFGRLDVCCILSQLQRARLVHLVAPDTLN